MMAKHFTHAPLLRAPYVTIDLNAFAHNIARVPRLCARAFCITDAQEQMPMGHGMIPLAQACEGTVEAIGVARIDAAELLRDNHITSTRLFV